MGCSVVRRREQGSTAAPFSQAMGVSNASTAIVFARLDPILKNLLEGLTSLKALLPALSATNSHSEKLESTFVSLVKSISNELESLSEALVLKEEPFQQQQRLQHAKALCLLTKYITLPLNAIFRLALEEIFAPPQDGSDGKTTAGKDQRLAIRRSYVYKMYHLAAIAMQHFIQETTIQMDSERSSNLLPVATWVEHLVALVHSMPTYSEITQQNATITNSSLDDGSNAYCAMLEATNSLLACFATTTTTSSSSSSENLITLLLKEAWHGTLSMRLVDCLTAFLVCSPSEVFTSPVHQKALKTLLTMLLVTNPKAGSSSSMLSQSQAFWRSVFPGVFTAQYQRITNHVTSKSKKPSSSDVMVQIQKFSLESLLLLLRMTLSKPKDDKETNSTFSSTDKDLNSNDDLLAKLNSMVVSANSKQSDKSRSEADKEKMMQPNPKKEKKEINSANKEEQFFYEQVRKRVESPLVFLLRQLSLSAAHEIRRNVVVLCKIILFETRECWEEKIIAGNTATSTQSSTENLMKQIPLEVSIAFLQDPDDSVRISAREIIDSYFQIQDTDSSNSSSTWIVSRVIELVQKLSALVCKGKTNVSNITSGIGNFNTTGTELRTDLNLLAGYLECLVTSSFKMKNAPAKESRAMNISICNSIVSSRHLRRGLIRKFDLFV